MSTFDEVRRERQEHDAQVRTQFEDSLKVEGTEQAYRDQLGAMVDTKLDVEQFEFQKNIFGFGHISENRQEQVRQMQQNADFLKFALTTNKLQFTDEMRAKMEAFQGRQMSFLLLNDYRSRKDSPEMKAVKDAIKNVEICISTNVDINVTDKMLADAKDRQNEEYIYREADKAQGMMTLYENAIIACKNYLDTKNPSYKKGQERWLAVQENMKRMMREQSRLSLGLQFIVRGKITKAKTVSDLIRQAAVLSKNLPDISMADHIAARKKWHNNYTNEKGSRGFKNNDYFPFTEVKKPGARMVIQSLFNLKSIEELFKIGSTGKLTKEQIGQRNNIRKLRMTLLNFPKNRFHSETLTLEGVCFNLVQTENRELILTTKGMMYSLPATAETLADRIGVEMIGMEEVMGEDVTLEIAEVLEKDLDMNDLYQVLRTEQYANAIITKRLNIPNTALANISIDARRHFARMLVHGTDTKEQVAEFIAQFENTYKDDKDERINDFYKKEDDMTQHAQVVATCDSLIRGKEREKNELEQAARDNARAKFESFKKADFKKLQKEDLITIKQDFEKALADVADNLDDEGFGAEVAYEKELVRAAEAAGLDKDVPNDEILNTLEAKIAAKKEEYEAIHQDVIYREAYYSAKDNIEKARKEYNAAKKKAEVAKKKQDYDVALYEHEKKVLEYNQKKEEEYFAPRNKHLKDIEEAKKELAVVREKIQKTTGSRDKLRTEYEIIKRKIKASEDELEKLNTGLVVYDDKKDTFADDNYNQNVKPFKDAYDRAKSEVKTAKAKVDRAEQSLNELFDVTKEYFMTEDEKKNYADKKKAIEDDIAEKTARKKEFFDLYENEGGKEGFESLRENRENLQLDKDETLTDVMINDAATAEKIRLYNANKLKYDQMIKFEYKAEEKDKDSLIEEDQLDKGEAWTSDEQAVLDMLADFIYNPNTWTMDQTVNDPVARVQAVFTKHAFALVKVMKNPEILTGIIDRLPLSWLDEDDSEKTALLDQALTGGFNPEDENIEADTKRIRFKKTLLSKFEEIKSQLPVEELNTIYQSVTDTEKEYQDALAKVKEAEAAEAQAIADGKPVPMVKIKVERNAVQNFFGFFTGMADEEYEEKSALKHAQEKLKEAQTNRFLKDTWSKTKIILAFGAPGVPEKLAGLEKSLTGIMDTYLGAGDLQKQLAETVDNIFPESNQKMDLSKIKSPKEKKISQAEKEKRINEGNEALADVIRESLQGSEGQGKFVKNVMKNYIFGVNKLDLRSMMSSAIRNAKPLNSDPTQVSKDDLTKTATSLLGGAFKGAGPLMHKILQGIPDGLVPEAMKDSIKDMKCNLSHIPETVVRAELASIIERSDGEIRNIIVNRSLGAASIGEAFLCTLVTSQGNHEECVIKILRPDARNKMERESKIMLQSAKEAGEGMYFSYKGMLEVYKNELDFTIEAKNAEKGKLYERKAGGGVTSMDVLKLSPASTNSMILKRARGETVDHMLDTMKEEYEYVFKDYYVKDEKGEFQTAEDGRSKAIKLNNQVPDLKRIKRRMLKQLAKLRQAHKRMLRLAKTWVTEGVFGDGFYHGDLHAGNIMNSNFDMTVIDYGNATQLTKFQQENITIMMVAAAAGDMEGFRECFRKLLENTSPEDYKKKEKELGEAIKEVFSLGDSRSTGQRIAAALLRAQQIGFEIPNSIFNFSQCQLRLQNTIEDMNTQIRKYQTSLKEIERVEKEEGEPISFDLASDLTSVDDGMMQLALKQTLYPGGPDSIKMMIREKDPAVQESMRENHYAFMSKLDKLESENTLKFFIEGLSRKNTATVKPEMVMKSLNSMGLMAVSHEEYEEIRSLVQAYCKTTEKTETRGTYDLDGLIGKITSTARKYNHIPLLKEYQELLAKGKNPDKDPRMLTIEKDLIPIMGAQLANYKANFDEEIRMIATAQIETDISMNEMQFNQDMITEEEFRKNDRELKASKEKAFEDLKKKVSPTMFLEKLEENLKITDVNTVKLCEVDLKKYFNNKEHHGDELKAAYDAFRKAQRTMKKEADQPKVNELMKKFIDIYGYIVATGEISKEDRANETVKNYDKTEPDDFLVVMGDVVMENQAAAILRLGTKVAKYSKALADS